jgi:hypothetical protein
VIWQWAQSLPGKEFSRKDAIEATGFPARTVESIIKKLFEMKKLTSPSQEFQMHDQKPLKRKVKRKGR